MTDTELKLMPDEIMVYRPSMPGFPEMLSVYMGMHPPESYGAVKYTRADLARPPQDARIADVDEMSIADFEAMLKKYCRPEWNDIFRGTIDGVRSSLSSTQTEQTEGGVPEGYVMVPIEPTEEMIDAWNLQDKYHDSYFGMENYKAMIKAVIEAITPQSAASEEK